MREAPELPVDDARPAIRRRFALLVNPFYPKDPHASFGKHVLTPTLALTSVAAATPPRWEVAAVWRPLVELSRRRHLRFRRRLACRAPAAAPGAVVSAGV
jgi:hypothetical protein